jgi:hypothetical protein
MIKNGVNITGLSDTDELSKIACEHIITFSHSDYIFINRRKHPLNQLISVNISVDISNNQKISLKNKAILLVQGIKQFTLEYRDDRKKRAITTRNMPFTETIVLGSVNSKCSNLKLYTLDATLQILNHEVVLSQVTYLLAFDGDILEVKPNVIINAFNNSTNVEADNIEIPDAAPSIPNPDKIAKKISLPEENLVIDSSKFDIDEEFL